MPAALQRKLREALGRFQAGDLPGAERLCREILAHAPRNPEALHLMGMARLAAGSPGEAVSCIQMAMQADPGNAVMLEHLGLAQLALRDYSAAEAAFRRALQLGAIHALLYMRLGLALLPQHRATEALAALRTAAEKAPDDPDVQLNLGNALAEAGEAEGALASYRRFVLLRPGRAEGHFNIGTQLMRMGRLVEAESAYRDALAADPRYEDAHHNLGLLFQQRGQADEAAASYQRVLEINPRHVPARSNLGSVLRAQGRFEEAVQAYEQTLAIDPGCLDAHVNLGIAWAERGRYAEARTSYERALALKPGFADAQYNLGVLRLYGHDFGQGWPAYEQRLQCMPIRSAARRDLASVALYEGLPRWQGPAETAVDSVAIWAEQGIGDQLLFSTLIPELIAAGKPIVYEVDGRLLEAYQRRYPQVRFVPLCDPPRDELQRTSRVLLAGSLPGLYRRNLPDFERQPAKLLEAAPGRIAHFQTRLDALGSAPKVALSWRSARKDYWGPRKSSSLAEFAPLFHAAAHFVDVQYGDTRAERVSMEEAGMRLLHFDEVDYYNDLEDLLAILEACDLLITTSNVNAHLAGALGKRTWLLYLADQAPFHYWAHGGSYRSLWYPSVEIVTAPHLTDWPSLLRHVADKLRASGELHES